MSHFEATVIKDRKNELEIEFKEKFFKKIKKENLKFLSEEEWKKGEKEEIFYKEVSPRSLGEALKVMLVKRGLDAYTYEPHPLSAGCRLNISGKNSKKKLKKAIKDVEKEWKNFEKSLQKKLK